MTTVFEFARLTDCIRARQFCRALTESAINAQGKPRGSKERFYLALDLAVLRHHFVKR
jgi:hypothetical protein